MSLVSFKLKIGLIIAAPDIAAVTFSVVVSNNAFINSHQECCCVIIAPGKLISFFHNLLPDGEAPHLYATPAFQRRRVSFDWQSIG